MSWVTCRYYIEVSLCIGNKASELVCYIKHTLNTLSSESNLEVSYNNWTAANAVNDVYILTKDKLDCQISKKNVV